MTNERVPWKELRQAIPGLSQREVARRTGINSGRLSIIERGVQPTPDEEQALRRVLVAAHLDIVPNDAA